MNKLEDLLDNFWNTHKNNAGVAYVYSHKLSIAWALCVIIAIVLGLVYQGKAAMFRGIAEASETIISVPSATEIVKVHVVPGQEIQVGDTIVEINRPDLTLRISEVTRELDALQAYRHVDLPVVRVDHQNGERRLVGAHRRGPFDVALELRPLRLWKPLRHGAHLRRRRAIVQRARPDDRALALPLAVAVVEDDRMLLQGVGVDGEDGARGPDLHMRLPVPVDVGVVAPCGVPLHQPVPIRGDREAAGERREVV